MHDLDTRNKDILVDIDSASDDYLRKVRDLSPTKRKAEMEKIQEKGRLSQSETEEEEEIPVKKKVKDKKKGSAKEEGKKRKKQKNEPQTTPPSPPSPNLPVPQEVL